MVSLSPHLPISLSDDLLPDLQGRHILHLLHNSKYRQKGRGCQTFVRGLISQDRRSNTRLDKKTLSIHRRFIPYFRILYRRFRSVIPNRSAARL